MDAGAPPKTETDTPLDRGAILAWLREDDPSVSTSSGGPPTRPAAAAWATRSTCAA